MDLISTPVLPVFFGACFFAKPNGCFLLPFDYCVGVPDSLLKDFCAYVSDTAPSNQHIITSNEGSAIAVASGYHLSTRKYPIVYMQNSGLFPSWPLSYSFVFHL
jgi:hypothetical protein